MSKHTPGPWIFRTVQRTARTTASTVFAGPWRIPVAQEANAQRIVDCVNFCEGINPKGIPQLVQAAKEAVRLLRVTGTGLVNQAHIDRIAASIAMAEGDEE